ncbi:MAG: glycosyltransferase [Paramuribaculum sp.]|nr:glycosyltransferase [Paramuribaculum sp.]
MIPDLSVIVPYHNSESSLGHTLVSIYNQTGTNLEVILVNDGSTDNSHKIVTGFIQSHPSKHKFIDICYNHSRGASEAFNIGLKNATANFVCKCDSDDTLSNDYYALMLDKASNTNADIVVSPITVHKGHITKILQPKSVGYLNDMAVNTANFSLCNKIIKRKLLIDNSIEAYPHIDRWDDLGVVARIIALRPKVATINNAGYHYILTPGVKSLSRSSSAKLLRDHLMCAMLIEIWLQQHNLDKEYAEFIHHLKILSKVKLLRCPPRNVEQWKSMFPEANHGIMSLRHISLFHRLLFALTAKLPTGLSQRVADIIDSAFNQEC